MTSVTPPSRPPDDTPPDPGRFDQFYRDEWHQVFGLALTVTGDRGVAEDLTQEAFVAAYQDWDRIGRYDKPGAFLRRVVLNRSVSRFRRLGRERGALFRWAGRRRDPVLPPELDESWELVRRLPARQAQVFVLSVFEDLTIAEVAEVLEIGTETVKTHLARARESLSRAVATGTTVEERS